MFVEKFKELKEYAAAGLYEEENRSLFYRKALGLRRYYETCSLNVYKGEFLYPSGVRDNSSRIYPSYMNGLDCDDSLCGFIYGFLRRRN